MQRPTVGILGDEQIQSAVTAAGGNPLIESPTDLAATPPSLVVAVGNKAVLQAVRADIDAPLLPVATRNAYRPIPREQVTEAVSAILDGEHTTVSLPVATARSPLGETRALSELMLVTGEPARISEYTVRSRTDEVAQFRADGVVVATPVGSVGYTRQADGPVLAPELDAFAVVPIAPFSTDEDMWVLPADGLELRVERDETPVELLADDRTAGSIVPGESVRIGIGGHVSVAVVDASARRLAEP